MKTFCAIDPSTPKYDYQGTLRNRELGSRYGSHGCTLGRTLIAAILLATSASAAELPAATPLVSGQGDQTDPSLSGSYIVYLGTTESGTGQTDTEIFRQSLTPGSVPYQLTDDDVDQGAPVLVGQLFAYRSPNLVVVRSLLGNVLFTVPVSDDASGRPGETAFSSSLVAWVETGASSGTDVGWRRIDLRGLPVGDPTVLRLGGDQHAVAVAGGLVAFVDGGVVRLVDPAIVSPGLTELGPETPGVTTLYVPGTAQDVAISPGVDGTAPVLAVLSIPVGGSGADEHVYVVSADGGPALASLETEGHKINPRIYGEWVGFEAFDETLKPQVTLWHHTDVDGLPWLFLPSPTGTWQKLHDLVVSDTVQVVWSDDSSGDFDIYFFQAPVADVLGTGTGGGPATCDTDAAPIAWFDVTRTTRSPTGGGTRFTANVDLPVLVCIEATDVTSGWIGIGSEVVSGPGDFGLGAVKREVRMTVKAGEGRAGASVAGGPGATLRVRIFADGGGGNGNGASDGATCAATGDCPTAPPGLAKDSTLSCSTPGDPAALAALLFPAAALLAPRRRRARR